MTTYAKESAKCAVCGEEAEYTCVASTNRFGSPDLDTRPPPMERDTISAWVQRCPGCGYCADDVSEAGDHVADVVHGAAYKEQLNNETYPELANSFLCYALINQAADEHVGAAWALIRAVWVCDDNNMDVQAAECRSKAADKLVKVAEKGGKIFSQDGVDAAIHVDLLRRAGRSDEAKALLMEKRGVITDDIISKALAFEETLLDKNDTARHTIAEAVDAEHSE